MTQRAITRRIYASCTTHVVASQPGEFYRTVTQRTVTRHASHLCFIPVRDSTHNARAAPTHPDTTHCDAANRHASHVEFMLHTRSRQYPQCTRCAYPSQHHPLRPKPVAVAVAVAVARASICFTVQRAAHLARMAVHTDALNGCQWCGARDVKVGVT